MGRVGGGGTLVKSRPRHPPARPGQEGKRWRGAEVRPPLPPGRPRAARTCPAAATRVAGGGECSPRSGPDGKGHVSTRGRHPGGRRPPRPPHPPARAAGPGLSPRSRRSGSSGPGPRRGDTHPLGRRRSVLSGRAGPLTPPGRRRPRGPGRAACAPRLRAPWPPPPAAPARAAGPPRASPAGGAGAAHVRAGGRPGSARSGRAGGWTALGAPLPARPSGRCARARPAAAHSLTRRRCASVRPRGERRRAGQGRLRRKDPAAWAPARAQPALPAVPVPRARPAGPPGARDSHRQPRLPGPAKGAGQRSSRSAGMVTPWLKQR